jgi:hypothetical protein
MNFEKALDEERLFRFKSGVKSGCSKVVHAIFTGVRSNKLRTFRIGPVSVNGLGKFQCHARLGAVPLPPPVSAMEQ